MLISTEFLLSLLVALGIGKYSNHVSPDYYTMITEQGKEYNLKIDTIRPITRAKNMEIIDM